MTEKLLVPDIGDFENVEVIELLVKEGQEIKKDDPVITIESDKSSVEVPSIFSGKIESIEVKVGDKVSKGDLILNITSSSQKSFLPQDVPNNTENLIQEAENSLKKNEEKKQSTQNIKKLLNPLNGMLIIINLKYSDKLSNSLRFNSPIIPKAIYETVSAYFIEGMTIERDAIKIMRHTNETLSLNIDILFFEA